MVDDAKYVIGTTDSNVFQDCRVRWNYWSDTRNGIKYLPGLEHFEFGSAVHKGLETIYSSKDRDHKTLTKANYALYSYLDNWRAKLKSVDALSDELSLRISDLQHLGYGMLNNYMNHINDGADDAWEILKVEEKFEVPIPIPQGMSLPFNPAFGSKYVEGIGDTLTYNGYPVVYQGTIDLIINMDTIFGVVMAIIDHKTTKKFYTSSLDKEPQASAYYWACRVLGLPIKAVVFNYLRKSVPGDPELTPTGKLSKKKGQDTTKKIYKEWIYDLGLNPDDFVEFLDNFEDPEYFMRLEADRNEEQLKRIGEDIYKKAIDMLDQPYIYPRASSFGCRQCEYYTACNMRLEGEDDIFYLKNHSSYVHKLQGKETQAPTQVWEEA